MDQNDIIDAINERLIGKWPQRTMYIDVCPEDFERPSFWIASVKYGYTDACRTCVRKDLTLQLTLYDERDDHYETSWERLQRESGGVIALLTPPLHVGTRHPTLNVTALPRQPDRAVLQIHTEWMDARPGLIKNTTPAAGIAEVSAANMKG